MEHAKTDDRDGTAAGGRAGRRDDPHGDGADLRHDPGAARRRGDQGRAAGRRQDPQPRRHGNVVLSAVQPRQTQRRAGFRQSRRPRDHAPAARQRRRVPGKFSRRAAGEAGARRRRTAPQISASDRRRPQGLSVRPLRASPGARRSRADDVGPRRHDRHQRKAAARRLVGQRHHGRHVRRDLDSRRALPEARRQQPAAPTSASACSRTACFWSRSTWSSTR